jgi:hypothetical protein
MNNPPAFPCPQGVPPSLGGMTLRDYFAAQAMSGILTDTGWMGNTVNTLANMSYEVADAMLKAREA